MQLFCEEYLDVVDTMQKWRFYRARAHFDLGYADYGDSRSTDGAPSEDLAQTVCGSPDQIANLTHSLCRFSPLAIFLNSSCGTPAVNLSKPPNTSATVCESMISLSGFLTSAFILTRESLFR